MRSEAAAEGDPLRGEAAQWTATSALLFQPEGLGLAVEPALLEAGVASVGALCVHSSPFLALSTTTWVKSTTELRHAFPRIGGSEADEAALRRVLVALAGAGAAPATPERDQGHVVCAAQAPRCTLQAVGTLMRQAEQDRRSGGWR